MPDRVKAALGYTAVAAAAVCERSARFITKADICLRMPGLLADKVLYYYAIIYHFCLSNMCIRLKIIVYTVSRGSDLIMI